MSVAATEFEKALQTPAHAKSSRGSQDRAHGFVGRIRPTATAERVADER